MLLVTFKQHRCRVSPLITIINRRHVQYRYCKVDFSELSHVMLAKRCPCGALSIVFQTSNRCFSTSVWAARSKCFFVTFAIVHLGFCLWYAFVCLFYASVCPCTSVPLLVLCWNFRTICGGQEPSMNRVVVPARHATQAGGIPWNRFLGFLEF